MPLKKLINRFRSTSRERELYAEIVSLARQEFLYRDAGVPDTVTGRFDMITLHGFMVLEQFSGKGDAAETFAQNLFDEVFLDMDRSLREMGVGDLSVGKRVRKMSELFYGACAAYRLALRNEDEADRQNLLRAALKRNVLGDEAGDAELDRLSGYALEMWSKISGIGFQALLKNGAAELGALQRVQP